MTSKILNLTIDDLKKLKKILTNENSRKKRKIKIKKVLKKYNNDLKTDIKKYLKSNNYNLDGIKSNSDMKGYVEKNIYDNRFLPQIGNNNLENSINNLKNELNTDKSNRMLEYKGEINNLKNELNNNFLNSMLENKKDVNNLLEYRKNDGEIANMYLRDINTRIYDLEEELNNLQNKTRFQTIENEPGDFGTSDPMKDLHTEKDLFDDDPEDNENQPKEETDKQEEKDYQLKRLFTNNEEEYNKLYPNKEEDNYFNEESLLDNEEKKEKPIIYNEEEKLINEKPRIYNEEEKLIYEKPRIYNEVEERLINEIKRKYTQGRKVKGLHLKEVLDDYIRINDILGKEPDKKILETNYFVKIEGAIKKLLYKI